MLIFLHRSGKVKYLLLRNIIVAMVTNLSIDTELLEEALRVGGLRTKEDTVNQALKEFVQRRKQQEIIELFGNFPCDDDYDYKKVRK